MLAPNIPIDNLNGVETLTRFIKPHWIFLGLKRVSLGALTSVLLLEATALALPCLNTVSSNAVDNQIILAFSEPAKASLTAPIYKGQRRLIVDIPGASLNQLSQKETLLKSLQTQLPDVAFISLDEFRGSEPLVRLVVGTQHTEIGGALMSPEGNRIVLQLLKSSQYPSTPVAASPSPAKSADISSTPQTVDTSTQQLQQSQIETQDLKETIVEQQKEVEALKATTKPASTPPAASMKTARIEALEKALADLSTRYEALQKDNDKAQKTIQDLNTLNNSLLAKQGQKPKPQSPDELVTTLDSYSPSELEQLLRSEKAYKEGYRLQEQGDLEAAKARYQHALSLSPKVKTYALALAGVYVKQQKYDPANDVLSAALNHHPDDASLLNEMGKVALLQKDHEKALQYFKKALPIGILSNYAIVLNRSNHPNEAEAVYLLAIDARPQDSDLPFNLGNLYLNQKRFQEAKDQYLKAIQLNPEFAEAHYHLGLTYAELGKTPDALVELSRYLQLMPNATNKEDVERYIQTLQKERN